MRLLAWLVGVRIVVGTRETRMVFPRWMLRLWPDIMDRVKARAVQRTNVAVTTETIGRNLIIRLPDPVE